VRIAVGGVLQVNHGQQIVHALGDFSLWPAAHAECEGNVLER
jgi:hypothetical protein